MSFNRRLSLVTGWMVFAIAMVVYFFSVERSGSLWDCGEFILGAYKLQVVHPPGAPLFLLVGRLFTWVATLFSDNPSDIAFAVNLMSGMSTAFAAAFVAWGGMRLSKLALVGREAHPDTAQSVAIAGAGLVAGLSTAFASSIWFSAVEGEVYAMSTFFTALTFWALMKWYGLPNEPQNDRWIIFAAYAAGLSIGVHLLSLLTFPALAMFYYFKKSSKQSFRGAMIAAGIGVALIAAIQLLIIVGIPRLWASMELFMVNTLGLPFHSGLIPVVLIIGAAIFLGLRYAHKKQNATLQQLIVGASLVIIGFSTIGIVVLRANANTPVNMNNPYDAMRLLPYLNREQYGERALLRGPSFDAQPVDTEVEDRYGRVDDKYEIVDQKISYIFPDKDKMLFPRMGDYTQNRGSLYMMWMGLDPNKPLPNGRPNQLDNISFLVNYQLGWMYFRYFMWNFAGRQNGTQGYYPWDKSRGHWISGIDFLDNARLGFRQSDLPETMKNDKARNKYYLLPLIFGIMGMFFHARQRPQDFLGLLSLFIITGIGIIIYSNQPPNEPRERDYVLVGSFFTFAIWIGMGVLAIFQAIRKYISNIGAMPAAVVAGALVLVAPILMGTQNYDDHSRMHLRGARDYAVNFLESCKPNAIIFTYGDNDTYPLWYAQEVEGVRPDVRVVNLSLIAVDWYIDLLRRKVNDSPAVKLSIPHSAYRGSQRNQVFYGGGGQDNPRPLKEVLKFIGEKHPINIQGRPVDYYYRSSRAYIPVDAQQMLENGLISDIDTSTLVPAIPVNLGKRYILKDQLAIMDIVANNIGERPIYFAVTVRQEKLMGMQDFMQLEGLSLQVVPFRNASDRNYGIIGNGRVAADEVYENVMNEFEFGNFDKYDMYVDHSFAPSIQSHQLAIRRAAMKFIQTGENEKAVELVDKYFEGFPHMNFPYDYRTYFMLQIYFQTGAFEKAKPHLEILARETADHLAFYETLNEDVLDSSFSDEFQITYSTKENILRDLSRFDDEEFVAQIEGMLSPFNYDLPDPIQ